MDKTLGQVAFDRFWELSPFKDDAPSNWAGRGPVSQAAWEAAAEAVADEAVMRFAFTGAHKTATGGSINMNRAAEGEE